jgi:hypothetical protein
LISRVDFNFPRFPTPSRTTITFLADFSFYYT